VPSPLSVSVPAVPVSVFACFTDSVPSKPGTGATVRLM